MKLSDISLAMMDGFDGITVPLVGMSVHAYLGAGGPLWTLLVRRHGGGSGG